MSEEENIKNKQTMTTPYTMAVARQRWTTHLDALWDTPPVRKMDWAALEADLRGVLRDADASRLTSDEALVLVDDLLAAHTGRGNTMSERGTVAATKPPIQWPDAADLDTKGYSADYRLEVELHPSRGLGDGAIKITVGFTGLDGGASANSYNGRSRVIATLGGDCVGESALAWLQDHEDDWRALDACFFGEDWDGSNIVGRWSAEWADNMPYSASDEISYYWSAADWLEGASWESLCVDANTDPDSPTVLEAVADSVMAFADNQNPPAYLDRDDLLEHLADRRSEWQDKETES